MLAYAGATGLAYALLSQTVSSLTALGESTSATFWPGAGLTLGVLLARPRREWPLHLAAVFLAETLMDVHLGYGWALGVQWGATNTLEPLVGAALLTWGRRAPDVGLRRDLPRFLAFAVMAGPAVGALAGTLGGVLLSGGPWWPRLPQWFVGDAVGALVVAPAVLLLASGVMRWPSRREIGGITVLLAGTLLAVGPWQFSSEVGLPFLVVPGMIAFAAWTGPSGTAIGVLALSLMVFVVTATGHGPFASADDFHGLVVAQMFLVMAAVSSLTMAAMLRELVSRADMEQRLRAKALTDNLTGLANRELLFDRIDRASMRLSRTPGRLALLFIDLDRFKELNDRLGHASGDEVLIEVGRRLQRVVRGHDTVARLGGDEFLVLVEDLEDPEQAEALAGRVVRTLSEPFPCSGGVARLGASVGYVVIDEPTGAAETFVAAADRAMYGAKRQGGGRALAATPQA